MRERENFGFWQSKQKSIMTIIHNVSGLLCILLAIALVFNFVADVKQLRNEYNLLYKHYLTVCDYQREYVDIINEATAQGDPILNKAIAKHMPRLKQLNDIDAAGASKDIHRVLAIQEGKVR